VRAAAVRAPWALVVAAVLGAALLGACTYGPRFVSTGPQAISNVEMGQDVPNDDVPAPVIIQCADFFHQDRPGGSDYRGPPIRECPPRWY
jgi:hypothetical protein